MNWHYDEIHNSAPSHKRHLQQLPYTGELTEHTVATENTTVCNQHHGFSSSIGERGGTYWDPSRWLGSQALQPAVVRSARVLFSELHLPDVLNKASVTP